MRCRAVAQCCAGERTVLAMCFLFFSLECFVAGHINYQRLTTCCLLQLGDGSTTNRNTPVGVSGLSSGVAMLFKNIVRSDVLDLFVIASWPLLVLGWAPCVFVVV